MVELQALLAGVAIIRDLSQFTWMPEVEETGSTFVANAVLKAEAVAAHTGCASLADDSGLVVDALNGAPGIYSARYAGPGASDADNRHKLLQELAGVPLEKCTAQFICALALAIPGKPTWTTTASHAGVITLSEQGEHGFGYDSLFFSPELGFTFAAVSANLKNQVSHRARALKKLKEHLIEISCNAPM